MGVVCDKGTTGIIAQRRQSGSDGGYAFDRLEIRCVDVIRSSPDISLHSFWYFSSKSVAHVAYSSHGRS